MKDFNTLIITGRLTKDVELKHFDQGNGFDVAEGNIAVNSYAGKGKPEEVSFFNIKAYNHSARFLSNYCKQGDQLIVNGEVKQDRWEKDGDKKSKVYISVHDVQIMRKKKTDNQVMPESEEDYGF